MRRCLWVTGITALMLVSAAGTGWGALRSLSGDVDNNANVWHTNNCGSGTCTIQATGDVRFTLRNNIDCGATRHLYLRLLFQKRGTVSHAATVASCAALPKTIVLASNVLATTTVKVEAMTDAGVPSFGDTKFGGDIGNVTK